MHRARGRDLPADIAREYDRHLRGRPLEGSLAATASYFVTLATVRVVTVFERGADRGYVLIGGVHVHHLVFGLVALLVAGLFALDEVLRIPRAVLFGVGAALVLDEFALLVFLRDVYWLPQGTLSVAALAIGLFALLVNMWRGRAFLTAVGAAIQRRL
jgi:hypothetical protein